MKFCKITLLSGIAACALCTTQTVTAQESSTQNIALQNQDNVYTPAYFTQYAPRTALDMVSRIPGFQFDGGGGGGGRGGGRGGGGKRGLGNVSTNILINDARVAGKTNPRDQLAAITAANVIKIEILDGASLGIPGLSGQIANITTHNTGISGTWKWEPEFRKNLEASIFPFALTVSGETGKLAYSVALKSRANRSGNIGPERLIDANGTVFEIRDENGQFYGDRPSIATNLTWRPQTDHIANLNLKFTLDNFNGGETSIHRAQTPRGQNLQTVFTRAKDEWSIDTGGDYEFPLGPQALNGRLKLIGVYNFEHSPGVSRFDVFEATGQTSGSRFFRTNDEGEAIVRSEYSWSATQGRDWQLGLEGAFNFLDIQSSLLLFNPTNKEFEQDLGLSGATSRVEEKRTEATLTHTRTLSPKWDVQMSAGVEYSQISQSGDASLVRDFIRPKGFVSTTYSPNNSLDIRMKIEREVGQLNFSDFVSSIDLKDDDLGSAGNSNLVPEQSWLGEIEFDKDFGRGNTFRARFYGELISDIVDRIPIGVNGDAVGNLDSAHKYGVDLSATIKGDKWGLEGTQLDLGLKLRQSSVEDPLLFFNRRLNRDEISNWSIGFQHDIPNSSWAYGGFMFYRVNAPSFRLSSIQQSSKPVPFTRLFLEHKDILGMKIQASINNIIQGKDNSVRQVFTDRRDIGVLDFTEDQSRLSTTSYRLEVSGSF